MKRGESEVYVEDALVTGPILSPFLVTGEVEECLFPPSPGQSQRRKHKNQSTRTHGFHCWAQVPPHLPWGHVALDSSACGSQEVPSTVKTSVSGAPALPHKPRSAISWNLRGFILAFRWSSLLKGWGRIYRVLLGSSVFADICGVLAECQTHADKSFTYILSLNYPFTILVDRHSQACFAGEDTEAWQS